MRKLYLLSTNLLLLLALAILCPGSPNTYAEDTSVARAVGASSVSIALSPSIDLELLPTAAGTTSYKATDLTISTNRSAGFRVLVNSSKTTDLVNNHHDEVISTISSPTALSSLPLNTWGIYLGATSPNSSSTFSPLATTPTELVHNELANASGTYKLAIGAKVDTSLPAGLYSNELVISVVAEVQKLTNLADVTYMQDVTSEICANTSSAYDEATGVIDKTSSYYLNPISVQLTDMRDGKTYWVAKLADGKCWMTQNLALNLGTASAAAEARLGKFVAKLTPADSNVSSDYTPPASTGTSLNGYSINFGKYVIKDPTSVSGCGSVSDLSECSKVQNVDDNWEDTYIATTTSAINAEAKTYDAHYLIGNYYTWSVASAGSSGSICPKGWKWPNGNRNGYYPDTTNDFYQLALAYGYPVNTDYITHNSYGSYTPIVQDGAIRLDTKPMYFVRGGFYYNPGSHYLEEVGQDGYYWTSTAVQYYYYFYFNPTNIFPSTTDGYGAYPFTIRCIVADANE